MLGSAKLKFLSVTESGMSGVCGGGEGRGNYRIKEKPIGRILFHAIIASSLLPELYVVATRMPERKAFLCD